MSAWARSPRICKSGVVDHTSVPSTQEDNKFNLQLYNKLEVTQPGIHETMPQKNRNKKKTVHRKAFSYEFSSSEDKNGEQTKEQPT